MTTEYQKCKNKETKVKIQKKYIISVQLSDTEPNSVFPLIIL